MKSEKKLLDLDGKDLEDELNKIIAENPKEKWTEKEILILMRLHGKVNTRIIAQKLGKSFNQVKHKISTLEVPLGKVDRA